MLQCVNEVFKAMYTPSPYAMGFTEGRSIVDNALKHKNKNYVFNTDLKDFFPSIEQPRIWKRLQLPPFDFPDQIARLLAGLCSMQIDEITDEEKEYHRCVLPQGAPTSPIITNMICDNLDRRLAGLAKRFGLDYSRYADDITFSSMHNVYQKGGDFIKELHRIIEGQGFKMNAQKTRLCRRGQRQEVTGITVNNKLNVTQKYVRDLRNILYIWEKYGLNAAFSKFFPKYKAEKGHVKKGTPDIINVLDGKLMYLKMVKGEEDSVYKRLYDKFRRLADGATGVSHTNSYNITYLETTPVLEFEKMCHTQIVITKSEPTTFQKKDPKTGSMKEISIPSHRYGYFVLDNKKIKVSVNKSIKPEEESRKEILAISNCRDATNKQFWLIHKLDKVMVPQPQRVDIDELIKQLESLLKS